MNNKKNYTFTLLISHALILLIVLCLFSISNSYLAQAQMPMPMPTSTPTVPPSNDQTILIISLVIAIIAITLVAVVIFYLVYSRKQKREAAEGITHVYKSTNSMNKSQSQKITSQTESRPFEVFLCYKKSSGRDYADHLKSGLEEVGLHTFEDCKDIPQTVNTQEGWSKVRDQALTESKYFVLIMTQGFYLSSEVINELRLARKQPNKTFVFFRHRSMGRKIVVNLGDEVLDIGSLEQVSFESKEELLRLAINILKS